MRQTSIEVYHQIKSEGLLSALRLEVYEALFEHGPCTQMELCRAIKTSNRQDRTYMPRFAELEKQGVIQVVGKRHCRITGREVLLWDVTDKLPVKIDKPVKIICEHCNGKGYFIEQQARLF